MAPSHRDLTGARPRAARARRRRRPVARRPADHRPDLVADRPHGHAGDRLSSSPRARRRGPVWPSSPAATRPGGRRPCQRAGPTPPPRRSVRLPHRSRGAARAAARQLLAAARLGRRLYDHGSAGGRCLPRSGRWSARPSCGPTPTTSTASASSGAIGSGCARRAARSSSPAVPTQRGPRRGGHRLQPPVPAGPGAPGAADPGPDRNAAAVLIDAPPP